MARRLGRSCRTPKTLAPASKMQESHLSMENACVDLCWRELTCLQLDMLCLSDGEEGLPFGKPEPCPWTCGAGPFGNVPWLTLLLDLTAEFQQLHQLHKDFGHAMPGEDALNSPLPEEIAEIPPLVHY